MIRATQRLKEYIVKAFAVNDERFRSGNSMNYLTEFQERIPPSTYKYTSSLKSTFYCRHKCTFLCASRFHTCTPLFS